MSSFPPFGLHYVRLFLSKRRHTGYTWQVTFLSSYSLLQGLASTATRIGYQPVAVLCLWGEEGLAWFNVTTLVRLKCRWPQMCHRWSHQLSTKIFKHHHVEETISPPQNSMAPKCKATTTYMFVSLTLLLVVCEKRVLADSTSDVSHFFQCHNTLAWLGKCLEEEVRGKKSTKGPVCWFSDAEVCVWNLKGNG